MLRNERTLASYNIKTESTLHVKLLIRGGSNSDAIIEDVSSTTTSTLCMDCDTVSSNNEGTVVHAEGLAESSSYESTSSSEPSLNIDLIEEICIAEFPPGKVFETKEELQEALAAVGRKHGFGISGSGKMLHCTRFGASRVKKSGAANTNVASTRKRTRINTLKCNCAFVCRWAYIINTFPHPEDGYSNTSAAEYRTTPSLKQVRIQGTSAYKHTNGCKPSYEQFHFQAKRTGKLFLKESEMMNNLLSILEVSRWNMDNQTLRAHLKFVNPLQSFVTADDLRNFRLWAKKESIKRQQSGKQTILTEKDLKLMFDDVVAKPDSSIAVEQAEELYRNVLRNTMEKGANTWRVDAYLASLKKEDPCFDFRMGRDSGTGAATIVLWQTGTMRADFELYGCALHLDFMKRKMNSYDWPYISVVAMDSNGSPRVVLEGIACTERHDAYVAAVRALLDMSPGRNNEEVLAVFADGALNADILLPENMNLPNARFIWDSYHLSHEIWPKNFGAYWCDNLSAGMLAMLYAGSSLAFDEALEGLEQSYAGNSNVLNKIHKIVANKEHYAKNLLESYPGTCGKTSNNPAEQNHSSIVAHLGGALYEEPASEIKLLLGRQRDHEDKRQQEKSRYLFGFPAEISLCQQLRSDCNLRSAREKLDKRSFELWKVEYVAAENYSCEVDISSGSRTFTHNLYHNSPRVLGRQERCSCATRVQHLMQCRHEIVERTVPHEKFCMDLIDRRHHFFPQLHNKVLRNTNIDGTVSTVDSSAGLATVSSSVALEPDGMGSATYDARVDASMHSSSATSRKQRKQHKTYNDIMSVMGNFASLAVGRGEGDMAYGVAIQLDTAMRNNGELVPGNLEQILTSFQRTFNGGSNTRDVTFSLSGSNDISTNVLPPCMPPTKPGSRTNEVRIRSKTSDAIKGNKTNKTCTFCSTPPCKSVANCSVKFGIGMHLKTGGKPGEVNEVETLHNYINAVQAMNDITHFPGWPEEKKAPLHCGVPDEAAHVLLRGIHSYAMPNGPSIAVAAVQFIAKGGRPLEQYLYAPMAIPELTKALHKKFDTKARYVFVDRSLYSSVISCTYGLKM